MLELRHELPAGPAVRLADTLELRVRGDRAGTGPLTWGQSYLYREYVGIAPYNSQIDIPVIIPLPPAARIDGVLDALRRLFERHEVLRTTFCPDGDGRPTQLLKRDLLIPVSAYELEPGDRAPAAAAREFSRTLRGVPVFDPDLVPVRVAITHGEGLPSTLYVVLSHMAIDGLASALLRDDFLRLLQGAEVSAPDAGGRPLDRVEWESSEQASVVARRSLDFIAGQLAAAPYPQLPGPPRPPAAPRYWMADMTSSAAALALRVIAHASRVSPAAALLGVYSAMMAARAGLDRFTVRPVVSNRLSADDLWYVGGLTQHSVITIRTAGEVREAIQHSALGSMNAVRYGRYPRPALDEVVHAVEARRGSGVELGCTYNFIHDGGWVPQPVDTDDLENTLRRLRRETSMEWWDAVERENYRLAFTAWGYPGPLVLRLQADTADFPQADITALLVAVERALCAVALGCTGIRAADAAGPGWG